MDTMTREERRQEVTRRRTRPPQPQRLFFPASGEGGCDTVLEQNRPVEICIETTDAEGCAAAWLTDQWWIQVQSACKHTITTVVILPTPNAMLDAVVLHQLEMLRRITPHWRLICYVDMADIPADVRLERLASLPYDEIRIVEGPEPVEDNFGSTVRDWVAQSANPLTLTKDYRAARLRLVASVPYSFR